MRFPKPLVLLTAFFTILTLVNAVEAQRNLKDIPDPDPLLELAELEVHPDFDITLFAADPRIAKPIQMNFDPSGRLWVASSEVYPQIEPGQTADDKILIIEDQDHNGVADTTTVFARGLLIPTGIEPGDGGAFVANSTELLHFKDTDGDGVADTERVMLSGFGTEDTHHILHTLRWGPDGLLYMNQSIYIHSHIETPYGVRRMNGGGVWHFRPETMRLEPYTYGLVNSWGHAIDKFGQSFQTDGAAGEGINYTFPDFVGITSPGAKRIFHGLNPGKPKLCGLEIVDGSHLPEAWRGDLITNDFRAHRVCRYELTEDGAGYAARELEELVKSRHQSFRPIDVKLGPDGAIYIADWYNPIIQHGEVDFRDPRRDHTHGRIWRIAAKDRPLLPYKDLAKAETEELLDLLTSDESYYRHHAKRVLKERGASEIMPHLRLARDKFQGRDRLEVLWVYQSLDVVNEELLTELLTDSDYRIRAGATRVLYHWQDRVPDKLELLKRLATDEHPRVRMEAAHALRRSEEAAAGLIALSGLEKPTDRFLEYALEQTADMTKSHWLPKLKSNDIEASSDALVFALKAADTAEAVPILLARSESWRGDANKTREVMQMVASRGTEKQLARVFELAMAQQTPDALRLPLLDALRSAAKRRKLKPAGNLDSITRLLDTDSVPITSLSAELTGLWQLTSHASQLHDLAIDETRASGIRQAAITGLAAMRQESHLVAINDASDVSPSVRAAAVGGLASFNLPVAGNAATELLSQLKPADQPERLMRAFLSQEGGDTALTSALSASDIKIDTDTAKLCVRVARSSGRDVESLIKQLQQAANLNSSPAQLTPAERKLLLADIAKHGNAAVGQSIYRRSELNCQKCHGIGGAGGKVGPDLASIGASAPPDYVLESMFDPGAKIKENYHSQIVATDEGLVVTGVLVRESDDSLILRDAEDREISIPLDSIEDRKDGGSLMPAGLLNDLTRNETVHLLSFLTELGKVGDFALPREPYVRTMETLSSSDTNNRLLRRRSEPEIGVDKRFQWQPYYAKVNGTLSRSELPKHLPRNAEAPVSYVRFQVPDVTKPRTLRLAKTDNIRVYLDGKPVRATQEISLPPGAHSVTLAITQTPADSPGNSPFSVLID